MMRSSRDSEIRAIRQCIDYLHGEATRAHFDSVARIIRLASDEARAAETELLINGDRRHECEPLDKASNG